MNEESKVNKNAKHKLDVLYKIWLGMSPTLRTPWSLTSSLSDGN